jgi:hypothetical protein
MEGQINIWMEGPNDISGGNAIGYGYSQTRRDWLNEDVELQDYICKQEDYRIA